IESMGVEGEVVAIKGDRVVVQLPNLRTTVDREELRPPGPRERARVHPPGPRPVANDRAARHFGAEARPVDPGLDDVVDLRGARVDEAIPLLETFLARAIEDDREVIVVRHGHGSGALRKLVREHLPHLRHVLRHRAGLPDEGGDAVTVVWVRG
ncbi:MAG TPA: Smr/MutS family protein, partial [Nannocystaceae bacterium]|nr:Smr/MutS family protein [Nannocystaceae bacterium]